MSTNREFVLPAPAAGSQTEAVLRERVLHVTRASNSDAVLTTDAEGRITFLNSIAESLTGWACHEAKGLPLETVFRIVNEESCRPAESSAARALRQGVVIGLARPFGCPVLLIARDGTEHSIDDSAAPIRDEQGNIGGCVLVVRDLSKEAAGALQASEVRYRRLFETAQDAILILDGDTGKITDSNPFLSGLLGYTPDELLGKQLWEIGLFQDIEASRAAFRQLQENGYIRYEDLPLETRDGRRVSVEFVSNVYQVEDCQVIQCNIRDISDRKRAEEALTEADRRKDEFLAMLSHELRSPLAPLLNALQLMRRKGTDDPDVQWARDVAERQVQQLTRLVDDLLDVARIRRGKINLQMESLDMAAVVVRAVEISRPLIDARKHTLAVSLPEQTVRVAADPTRLAQVVSNLLNNAAKYTEVGGCIELTVEPGDGEAVLRVRDTGVGIAADMLSQIFEIFTQVRGCLSRSEGGLGIGLALVRSLVEMHGGSVVAHSEGPGHGSEFVVRLPLLQEME
jgi:PAS domain S-box-containing protein